MSVSSNQDTDPGKTHYRDEQRAIREYNCKVREIMIGERAASGKYGVVHFKGDLALKIAKSCDPTIVIESSLYFLIRDVMKTTPLKSIQTAEFALDDREEALILMKNSGPNFENLALDTTVEEMKTRLPSLMSQAEDAFESLRILGILHMDIKPNNVLYDKVNDKLTVIDFGSAILDSYNSSGCYMNECCAHKSFYSWSLFGKKITNPTQFVDRYAMAITFLSVMEDITKGSCCERELNIDMRAGTAEPRLARLKTAYGEEVINRICGWYENFVPSTNRPEIKVDTELVSKMLLGLHDEKCLECDENHKCDMAKDHKSNMRDIARTLNLLLISNHRSSFFDCGLNRLTKPYKGTLIMWNVLRLYNN